MKTEAGNRNSSRRRQQQSEAELVRLDTEGRPRLGGGTMEGKGNKLGRAQQGQPWRTPQRVSSCREWSSSFQNCPHPQKPILRSSSGEVGEEDVGDKPRWVMGFSMANAFQDGCCGPLWQFWSPGGDMEDLRHEDTEGTWETGGRGRAMSGSNLDLGNCGPCFLYVG